MTVLLPMMMAYSLIGEAFHEITGTALKPLGTRAIVDSGCIFVLCTFPGGGYVHFEIDTLDTITLLENEGYLVIVSSVLRVKCYGAQSTGYRVIVSIVL